MKDIELRNLAMDGRVCDNKFHKIVVKTYLSYDFTVIVEGCGCSKHKMTGEDCVSEATFAFVYVIEHPTDEKLQAVKEEVATYDQNSTFYLCYQYSDLNLRPKGFVETWERLSFSMHGLEGSFESSQKQAALVETESFATTLGEWVSRYANYDEDLDIRLRRDFMLSASLYDRMDCLIFSKNEEIRSLQRSMVGLSCCS